MTMNLSLRMREATRLTREGRLGEASALLQRSFEGGAAKDDTATAGHGDTAATHAPRARIIDIDPETGEVLPGPAPEAGRSRDSHYRPVPGTTGAFQGAWRDVLDRLGKGMPDIGAVEGNLPGPLPGGLGRPSAQHSPEPLPAGARFEERSFRSDAGTRAYKLYIPSMRSDAPMPLVVMLHGCTQSPDDFAAGTRMNALAEERGLLVAYPAQPRSANAQKCWNWFEPGEQRRDQGEPALIAGITRQVLSDAGADPRRVFVAGLSAGGAAAAILGLAYPDLYAAIGVHSGLACGAARDMPSAFAAMRQGAAAPASPGPGGRRRVPAIVFHADRDTTVHPRNGEQVAAQFRPEADGALGVQTRNGRVPGGHAFTRTIHTDGQGKRVLEQWVVHDGGHAWSGGSQAGTYTDPRGPDASRAMLRFFLGDQD